MQRFASLEEVKEYIYGNGIHLLLVKTASCGVCDVVEAKSESILISFPGATGAAVFLEDVPEVSAELLVFTAPTVILFADGKEVERQSRFVVFGRLEDTLARWVSALHPSYRDDPHS